MTDFLQRRVLEMEERVARSTSNQPGKVAVFDLDGTLLEGDIGEAVFAQLMLNGEPLRLSWHEYQRLLYTHRSKAYRSVVQAMDGLTVSTIVEASREVISSRSGSFKIQSTTLQRPRPRPSFVGFLSFLRDRDYSIYVISASNHISVQYVATHWFGILPKHAFGIQTRMRGDLITSELIEPVPIGEGKVDILRSVSPNVIPLITATDSRIDIPLLNITHPLGISIWVGDDRVDFGVVTEKVTPSHEFCFLESNARSVLDDEF